MAAAVEGGKYCTGDCCKEACCYGAARMCIERLKHVANLPQPILSRAYVGLSAVFSGSPSLSESYACTTDRTFELFAQSIYNRFIRSPFFPASMNLYLTGSSFLNSEYQDSDGKTVYKVSTPHAIVHRTSTISRLIHSPNIESEDSELDVLGGRFAHLARIEFKVATPSVIYFKGEELDAKEMFRKEGWGWMGRHRVFTASDGKEYKWILGPMVPSLVLNDSTKQPIARFHRKGLFSKEPAYLEVYPEVETDIMDDILVSFVYIEKVRRDREREESAINGE